MCFDTQCVRDGKSFVIEGLHLDPCRGSAMQSSGL
jgi:hypothetical protein